MKIVTRDVEFRAADKSTDDGKTLSGYAAVFDQDTEINSYEGHFTERVAKGAFRKTLQGNKKPAMQWNHGHDSRVGQVPIGVYTSIKEDDHGLAVEGRLFENDVVEPVRQAIDAGAVTGMSFSFRVVRDEWRDNADKLVKKEELYRLLYEPGDRGPLQRTLKEVQLFEAGPVLTPAYSQTSVGVRSAGEITEAERESIAAEYRKSMLEPAPEEVELRSGEWVITKADAQKWVDAEKTFRWLEAETLFRWLDAEAEFIARSDEAEKKTSTEIDAADKGTSKSVDNPERNAAPEGTLQRESTKKATPESKKAPQTRKRAMTLTEMREALAIAESRKAELAIEARDAEFTPEAKTEYDGLETEIPSLRTRIADVEKRLAEYADTAATDEGRTKSGSFGAPAVIVKKDIYSADEIRTATPDQLFDNAKRAIDEARMGGKGLTSRETAQETALQTLENLHDDDALLAKRMLTTGSAVYERAWAKAVSAGNINAVQGDEYRALSLGFNSGNDGGLAVPFQLDPTVILTSAGVIDPLRQISRTVQITGKEWQGITSAGTSVSRDAESSEVSDDSFSLAQPTVKTVRVQGFIPFSYELAETWSAVRSEITRALVDAKVREEASSFMNGNGTAPAANGLLGTFNYTNSPAVATAEDTFAASDIYALEDALDARYRHAGSKFLANHSIYNKVRQFATTDGHSLWERIGNGQPHQLLGYEALESTAMSAATTNGTKWMIFGDFQNFLIVDRVGMSVELIPQVFGAAGRPTGQRGIYAIWMNNSKVLVDKAFKVLSYTNAT